MPLTKIPYEILIRFSPTGELQAAQQQFCAVYTDDAGQEITRKLLPASPFGSDPDFPATSFLGATLEAALASSALQQQATAALEVAQEELRRAQDALSAAQEAAQQEAATAASTIAQLQSSLDAATNLPEPTRPPGKWWKNAVAFLSEFTAAELQATNTSTVPDITKLLFTLLAWPGEVWAADERIVAGLGALESIGILTPERKAQILTLNPP